MIQNYGANGRKGEARKETTPQKLVFHGIQLGHKQINRDLSLSEPSERSFSVIVLEINRPSEQLLEETLQLRVNQVS
jgi:hypothetical protein